MKLSDILYMISEVPADKREGFLSHIGQEIGDIRAYHITSQENAENIKAEGLQAQSSRQSYDRPPATYFFLEKDEIDEESKSILLDNLASAEIIEVLIPRDEFLRKAQWDGLYNASFATRSAIQFFDNVPTDWLK